MNNPARLALCDTEDCTAKLQIMRGQDIREAFGPAGWTLYENETLHGCPDHPQGEGPDEGHTFRISVSSRMSSTVVGDEHHTDADYFFGAHVTAVRAWNLRDALDKAHDLRFASWGLDHGSD